MTPREIYADHAATTRPDPEVVAAMLPYLEAGFGNPSSVHRRGESAREAIFTRKVGHTQRGGRPILFDRFYAAQLGAKAIDMLLEGRNNAVAILQHTKARGFYVEDYDANRFRDRWGHIHARTMHADLYDPVLMKPSKLGVDYLLPIFTDAIGSDDAEHMRQTLFAPGNLAQPYHSINTDVHKRIRYLSSEPAPATISDKFAAIASPEEQP